MFQDPDNHQDRLDDAISQLRSTPVSEVHLSTAERAIMNRFSPPRRLPLRRLAWAGAAMAGVAAVAVAMYPRPSIAAELQKIAANGDVGMRHVMAFEVQPDGSFKTTMEFFAEGDRARLIDMYGDQIGWKNKQCIQLHKDGSAVLQHYTGDATHWMRYSARQILTVNAAGMTILPNAAKGEGAKTSLDHDVAWNGKRVDRFTLDGYFVDGQNKTLHSHAELFADPATMRPLEMRSETTGMPDSIERWEYPASDPKLLELPPVDPKRFYDSDAELASAQNSLKAHGPVVLVAGERVELLELWVDDRGSAAAIARANYSYPCNYSLKLDGQVVGSEPQDSDTATHWAMRDPEPFLGMPTQIFYGERHYKSERKTYPDTVSLSIPVVKGKRLVGYAEFRNVTVHHTCSTHMLLSPVNLPFWSTRPVIDSPAQAG